MYVIKSEGWYVKFDRWNKRVDTIEEATLFKTKKIANHAAKDLIKGNWAEIRVEEVGY